MPPDSAYLNSRGYHCFPWNEKPSILISDVLCHAKSDKKSTNHFNFQQGFIAIIQKIASFPAIYPDDTKQKLTTKAERHGRLVWSDYGINTVRQVGLEDVCFGELAL